jgi:hypothetical protein
MAAEAPAWVVAGRMAAEAPARVAVGRMAAQAPLACTALRAVIRDPGPIIGGRVRGLAMVTIAIIGRPTGVAPAGLACGHLMAGNPSGCAHRTIPVQLFSPVLSVRLSSARRISVRRPLWPVLRTSLRLLLSRTTMRPAQGALRYAVPESLYDSIPVRDKSAIIRTVMLLRGWCRGRA